MCFLLTNTGILFRVIFDLSLQPLSSGLGSSFSSTLQLDVSKPEVDRGDGLASSQAWERRGSDRMLVIVRWEKDGDTSPQDGERERRRICRINSHLASPRLTSCRGANVCVFGAMPRRRPAGSANNPQLYRNATDVDVVSTFLRFYVEDKRWMNLERSRGNARVRASVI